MYAQLYGRGMVLSNLCAGGTDGCVVDDTDKVPQQKRASRYSTGWRTQEPASCTARAQSLIE